MPGRDVGRFFRHSSVYAAGNAINRMGQFILLPVYTHFLTVSQYGQIELFYVIASLATGVLSVGIAHATLRFYFDYEDERDRCAVVSTNLIASFAISLVGVLPLVLAAEPIARGIFQDEALSLGVRLIFANVVLEISSQVCIAYVRAREKSAFFVAVVVAKLALQVAVNVALVAWAHAGVNGVLIGNVSAVALGWAVMATYAVRHCGLAFQWSKLVPVLKYSFPFFLSTLVGVISGNVDRLLINGLLDLHALGLFALAAKVAKLISDLIGEPVAQAYGAFRYTIMDNDNAADLQARIMRYLVAGCCFAGLALVYYTGPLLKVLATQPYWEAGALMPPLVAAAVINIAMGPTQTGIFWAKQTRHILHIQVLQAVVSVVAGYVLIVTWGLMGACLAVLVVRLVSITATNRISQRYFPVRYDYRRLGGIVALTVAFGLAGYPLEHLGPVAEWGLKGILLVLFALAAWRVGLDGGERHDLEALVRQRLGRTG